MEGRPFGHRRFVQEQMKNEKHEEAEVMKPTRDGLQLNPQAQSNLNGLTNALLSSEVVRGQSAVMVALGVVFLIAGLGFMAYSIVQALQPSDDFIHFPMFNVIFGFVFAAVGWLVMRMGIKFWSATK